MLSQYTSSSLLRCTTQQSGQALIEYAILLILLITLVMGSAELGIAAFHSNKTSEAAKAGANTWSDAIANAHILDSELLREAMNIDTNSQSGQSCASIPASPICADTTPATATDIRPKLESNCGFTDTYNNFNETLPIDVTACSTESSIKALLTYLYPTNTPALFDYAEVCTSTLPDNIERIVPCYVTNIKRLLISKQMIADAIGPSMQISLGNHDPSRTDFPFRNPSCLATNGDMNDYDDGLPSDGKIYLFNPLPIDITNCVNDANRGGANGASILVSGYKDHANTALNFEGLPKLNQAIYAQYTKVCVQDSGGDITLQALTGCAANGNRLWLKPPGKMCGGPGGGEVCPGIGDLNGATGFYFFGHANDAAQGNFTWVNDETPDDISRQATFRPAFQISCDGANHQNIEHDAVGACASLTGAFSLSVNVRYRSVFESFLTFGLQELTDASLTQYFYDPNKVGTNGALLGVAGSEIGPVGVNGRPSVKQLKDFRGCFKVEITPPDSIGEPIKTSVSSCH